MEAELVHYRRRKEEEKEENEDEERRKKEIAIQIADLNEVKIKLDETKMQLQTAELERKDLQVQWFTFGDGGWEDQFVLR